MKSDVWGAGVCQLVSSDLATMQPNFPLTEGSGPSQAKSTHWLWIWENLKRGERSQAPSFGQLSSYSSNWQWIKSLKRNCSDGTIWVIIGKRIYLIFLVFEQNLCHVYILNDICWIFNLSPNDEDGQKYIQFSLNPLDSFCSHCSLESLYDDVIEDGPKGSWVWLLETVWKGVESMVVLKEVCPEQQALRFQRLQCVSSLPPIFRSRCVLSVGTHKWGTCMGPN